MAGVSLPQALYLRHTSGAPIGPLEPRAVEALFDGQLIDGNTPISTDGISFLALSALAGAGDHLRVLLERLGRGEDAWTPSAGAASQRPEREVPRPPEVTPRSIRREAPAGLKGARILSTLLERAAQKANGHVRVASPQGDTSLTFRDGKIVAVSSADPALTLSTHLRGRGIVTESALAAAQAQAPSFGGDLGAALVAGGFIPAPVYFEQLLAWATFVVAAVSAREEAPLQFEPAEVPPPAVPLGFDHYGVLIEAVRQGFSRTRLQDLLDPKRLCPLIVSSVDGVRVEDCKLQPRELRALNAIDGIKSLKDLLVAVGSSEDAQLAVLRAIYFAERAGFVVFGEDPTAKLDAAETAELTRFLEQLRAKSPFDLFSVTEKSSDEEVRARYTDLAKKYHPDKARQGSGTALLELRRQVFALVNQAFDQVETEDKRYRLRLERDAGASPDDAQKVQEALAAETLFKKAEIFLKVRKFDEAFEHLEEAIRLKPKDTEFKISRAYAAYLRAARNSPSEAAAQAAIKEILGLMKNDANIASGYLYLGHLHKAVNKPELSLKYFEKLLEYDENHVEALREVRIANLRKDKKTKKKWL
jgi:tetratricopeptide (TPR) repeat protein